MNNEDELVLDKPTKQVKKVVSKPKIKLDFIITDLKDLTVLTNRFKRHYGVTLTKETDEGFVFEGKTHIVNLKKV